MVWLEFWYKSVFLPVLQGALEHNRPALELTQAWKTSFRAAWCSDGCWRAGALEPSMAVLEPIALEFEFPAFYAIFPQNLNFSLNDLQTAKTPKLQNTSENNKAKGLTSVN